MPETRGTRVTDTYFFSIKFELPKNASADRATQALEEFTQAINSKKAQQIPFSDKIVNKVIEVLSKLLSPNNQPDTNKVAPGPRVVERPRGQANKKKSARQGVDNNKQQRTLRPRPPMHDQKYSRGTRVNKKFGNK